MSDLLEYIKWRGDLSFEQMPLNEVDGLVFSVLAYIELAGIVPVVRRGRYPKISIKDAADIYFERHKEEESLGRLIPKETTVLFARIAKTKRYGTLRLSSYVSEINEAVDKQFAALAIHLPKGCFITFRGTDDTLIGWKEDFLMSVSSPVPSQQQALRYVQEMGEVLKGKLYLGGHSKGGNLAVYAGIFATKNIQKRIVGIFNNDGPGFSKEIILSDGYKQIKDRIHTFVPQSSIVGLLLEHEEAYQIIKSNNKFVMQHDPFSWEIHGNYFVLAKELTKSSVWFDKSIRQMISHMELEQKEYFIEGLFEIVSQGEYTTLSQLESMSLSKLVKTYHHMSHETKEALRDTLLLMISYVSKQMLTGSKGKKQEE